MYNEPDTTEETTNTDTDVDMSQSEVMSNGGVPVTQQLMMVGAIFVVIFGAALTPQLYNFVANTDEPTTPQFIPTYENTSQPAAVPAGEDIKPFSEVSVVGAAAYVWDVNAQRALYKKNEAERLPLASVTKLMTALLAEEILSEDATITITDNAIRQDGSSGFLTNESFERLALSDLVLMSSSNDGAFALAAAAGSQISPELGANAFIQAMNIRAEELGLTSTEFKNPTGLDVSTSEAGAYGSAKDVSFLMEYIIENEPDILALTQDAKTRVYSEEGIYHDANNTNFYIDEIPGLIGSKTGYTDLAGGNLVIAYDAGLNRPIIVTVLGSTRTSRFIDVINLVEETNRYLATE